MNPRPRLTPGARGDLHQIADQLLVEAGPITATRVVLAFHSAFHRLARFPRSGHRRPDLSTDPRVRFWPLHSWLVAYASDARSVTILAILHGATDPEALFDLLAALTRRRSAP
jgi:plasmid stabilization system protein ParE